MSDQRAEFAIEVRDLVFEYPSIRALHGVSLDVARGTITALVGPNGAGKTTLLRCIAALETPYSGSVRVEGMRVSEKPRQIHQKLGYLPDFFGLYDDLTVRQCLLYAALAHRMDADKAEAAATETADRVGLKDRINTRAGELSRGLRQRLAIGQSMVHSPEVLILDEPASGLDPQARRDLSRLLLDIKSLGVTQIVSSHILAELADYSDEMIIMDKGRVRGDGAISISGQSATIRVRIELAASNDGLRRVIERQEGVDVVQISEDAAIVSMAHDEVGRARLLKALVDAGIEVSAFVPASRWLEETYFEEVGEGET